MGKSLVSCFLTHGVDDTELVFSFAKGWCRGNQFLLVLSTELMGVAGRKRLVAQPGGLTLRFVLHLVIKWDTVQISGTMVTEVNKHSGKNRLP